MSYLVDVNILIYASNADVPQHARTREWLDYSLAEHSHTVGLPWPVLVGFVRITTHPKTSIPLSTAEAWGQVEDWLARPAAWTPAPTPHHAAILGKLLTDSEASGNLVSDAHLAALAVEHDLTVVSADQDFAQFTEVGWVRWVDPTQGS